MITMLLIAGICVPLMLFVKPLWVLWQEKKAKKGNANVENVEMVAIN
jgi:hypothetical protein